MYISVPPLDVTALTVVTAAVVVVSVAVLVVVAVQIYSLLIQQVQVQALLQVQGVGSIEAGVIAYVKAV